ncbi:MAG: hypothetical protein C4294_17065, partial [Nitrospiraceae bacterium]
MNAEVVSDNLIACTQKEAPLASAIRCPACGFTIPLEKAVTRQVRESVAKEFQARAAALAKKEKVLDEEIERRVEKEFARRRTQMKQEAERALPCGWLNSSHSSRKRTNSSLKRRRSSSRCAENSANWR